MGVALLGPCVWGGEVISHAGVLTPKYQIGSLLQPVFVEKHLGSSASETNVLESPAFSTHKTQPIFSVAKSWLAFQTDNKTLTHILHPPNF